MSEPLLWWGIALLGGALAVVALEMFIPSGGLLAVVSTSLAIAGVVAFFRHSTAWGLMSLAAVLVLGPVIVAFMLKIYPDTYVGRRMILGNPEPGDAPTGADAETDRLAALVGAEGVAMTDLHPVGTIRVEGERLEALAEIGAIDSGQRVRITSVEGTRIKVRAIV